MLQIRQFDISVGIPVAAKPVELPDESGFAAEPTWLV